MQIHLIAKKRARPQTAVIALFEKTPIASHPFFKRLSRDDAAYVRDVRAGEKFWGEKTAILLPLPSQPKKHILLMGLGDEKAWNNNKAAVSFRKIVAFAKEKRISRLALRLPDFAPSGVADTPAVRMAAENLLMADFDFTKYKEKPREGWPKVTRIELVVDRASPRLLQSFREGVVVGKAMNRCRVLANTPGGDMTPSKFAAAAQKEKTPRLRVRILNESQIRKLKMGGVLGVSQGSKEKPRFIVMEYRPSTRLRASGPKNQHPLVFVGKGVTFDTGGLNLKPETSIYEMHMDMSGGAAVITAVGAIARLRLPLNVVGLVPAVENMPSGSSYHPGDLLRTITGKTIEVLNTDAEGRIILADALGYAQRLKPRLMVDVATLTGAAMVALGQRAIALFTPSSELEKLGREVGETSGDTVWPLPLWDDYFEDIRGTFGDVANTGKTRYGGAISGAMFLKQFVGDYPWMHLDIAPTMTTIEGQYLAKGASGTGVRFLVELARRYAKE